MTLLMKLCYLLVRLRSGLCQSLSESAGELVGAGGAAAAAVDAAQTADEFVGLHTFGKAGYALSVAVASAGKTDVGHSAVVHYVEIYLARAHAVRNESVMHGIF